MKNKGFRVISVLALCLTLLTAAALASGSHDCVDADADHFCDECWQSVTTHCADEDGDHYCDVCGRQVRTDCTDADGDEWCDVCGGHLLQYCADEDKNHVCDACWALLSTCTDENKDHLCDICGGVFWVDANADGVCDGCEAVLTHVTAEHVAVYYHENKGATLADVVLRITVEPYIEVGGAPAGTVAVRWTDADGNSYSTADKTLTFGETTVTVEFPSLPMSALELGGRVTFSPYDAGFTPAENGCVAEHDLPFLWIDSDAEFTVNGVKESKLYLHPGAGVTVVQQPGLTESWEWAFGEGSAVPEVTVDGLTTTFVMPGESVSMYAAWRCEVCTDADGDSRCDVCAYSVEDPIYVGGVELPDGWYLSNDGTVSTEKPQGGYAHFKGGTLTLNSYEYTGAGLAVTDEDETDYALVFAASDLDIRVESPSALTGTMEGGEGIVAKGNVSFSGETLTLTVSGDGVFSYDGWVTLEEGDLHLTTGGAGIDSCYDLSVYNSELDMRCDGDGIYVYAGDLLVDNSSLTVTAAVDGIYLYDGGMKVSGSELLVNGGNRALFAYTYLELDEQTAVLLPEGGAVAELIARAGTEEEYTYYTVVDSAGEDALSVKIGKPCPSAAYTDVSADAWYHEAVDYVLENGLMDPVAELTFDPKGEADRATFVHALWKAAGSPVVNYLMMYEDVDQEQWYAEAVRWASAMGIAKGYPDGTFRPTETITRQQMAAFLYRCEQHKGGGFTGAWMFLLDCTDRADVAEWAYEPLCWLTMKGVMQGDGTGALKPQATATRAEAAQVIMNYMELG